MSVTGPRTAALTRIALMAAVYVVLTAFPPFSAFSYGPVQVRVAEALMVLPALAPELAWGLFLGCLVSNLAGGLGPIDLVFGSLATLAAGLLAGRMPRPWLVPVPTIVINALVVGTYLPLVLDLPAPFWLSWAYIAAGEAVATVALGLPLLFFLRARPSLVRLLRGR